MKRSHLLALLALTSQALTLLVQFALARRLGTQAVVDGWIAAQSLPALVSAALLALAGQLAMPLLARVREAEGEEAFERAVRALALRFAAFGAAIAALGCFPEAVIGLCAPGLGAAARSEALRMLLPLALGAAPLGVAAVLTQAAGLRDRFLGCAALSPLGVALALGAFALAPAGAELEAMLWTQAGVAFAVVPLHARWAGLRLRGRLARVGYGGRGLLAGALPVLVIASAARINLAVDTFFASSMPGGELALYGYATRGVSVVQAVLVAPVATLVFAKLSGAAARREWSRFAEMVRRATLLGWAASIAAALLLIGLGRELAGLFLGPAVGDGAVRTLMHCFVALSGITVFGVWGSILARACLSAGRLGLAVTFLGVVPVLANLVLDALLAPRFGVVGLAAVTSLNAGIGLPIVHLVLARGGYSRGPLLAPLVRYLACAAAAGALLWTLHAAAAGGDGADPLRTAAWLAGAAALTLALYAALVTRFAGPPLPRLRRGT